MTKTFEERLKEIEGANTFDIKGIVIGNPAFGGLSLNYLKEKLKTRKVLRVEEVIDILEGISVDLIFKHEDPEKDIVKFDTLTINLKD